MANMYYIDKNSSKGCLRMMRECL